MVNVGKYTIHGWYGISRGSGKPTYNPQVFGGIYTNLCGKYTMVKGFDLSTAVVLVDGGSGW